MKKLWALLCLCLLSSSGLAGFTAGNPHGSITLTEFFDYQCLHCKHFYPTLQQLIKDNPELRVAYRIVPYYGDSSWFLGSAVLAAKYQGKEEALHAALLQYPGTLDMDGFKKIVKDNHINRKKLKKDMVRKHIQRTLEKNYDEMLVRQLRGIPTLFLGKTGSKKTRRFDGNTSRIILQHAINQLKEPAIP